MQTHLFVDDATFVKYAKKGDGPPQKQMQLHLEKYADLPLNGKFILLSSEQLQELQKLLGANLQTGEDLLKTVKAQGRVKLGDPKPLLLSSGQKARMKDYASYMNTTPEAALAEVVRAAVVEKFGE